MLKNIILIIFSIFIIACSNFNNKHTFVASGTYVTVISANKQAASIVYNEFKRLEKIFSYYDKDSELSKLNATYNQPFKASKELIDILKLAKKVNELTQGAFDVSYAKLYSFWKELIRSKDIKALPDKDQIEQLRQFGGMENIEIDENKQTIIIKKPGLNIDLGAIAEGYMVDKAIMKLKASGIDNALIDAGGDIACLGTNQAKPWIVGIRDPKNKKEILLQEPLTDQAIATSGNYEQFFYLDGKQYSHLIDPRNGCPVDSNIVSVSVIAKNCTTCDSLSTAFFVMGIKGIEEFLKREISNMKIVVVTQENGKLSIHLF